MRLRYEDPPSVGPLRQGEILGDVFEHRVTYAAIGPARPSIGVNPISHPLVVVLNNVCDLQEDFKARAEEDKRGTESGVKAEAVVDDVPTADRDEKAEEPQRYVPYVHLCCLVGAEQLLRRPSISRGELDKLRKFARVRFHYFPGAAVGDGGSLPEVFVDFMKTFALPTPSLYEGMTAGGVRRIAVVPAIWVHDLVQRYHAFHSRVGLP